MKLKKFLGAASAAAILSSVAVSASADTTVFGPVVYGSSFTDLLIATINIGSLSDVTGTVFAAQSVTFAPPFNFTLTLDGVTFTSGSAGGIPLFSPSFSFQNVPVGSYDVIASGTLDGLGQYPGVALIGLNYTVTAVPEPESYALFLAGLGVMGAIARRRRAAQK